MNFKIGIIIVMQWTMVNAMDEMEIDTTNSPQYTEKPWIILNTTFVPRVSNKDRSHNLELIKNNINENVINIKSLWFVPEQKKTEIVTKLLSIKEHANTLYEDFKKITNVNPANQKILEQQIDHFSNIEFVKWQGEFNQQLINLSMKTTQAQENDYEQLLKVFNSINLNKN